MPSRMSRGWHRRAPRSLFRAGKPLRCFGGGAVRRKYWTPLLPGAGSSPDHQTHGTGSQDGCLKCCAHYAGEGTGCPAPPSAPPVQQVRVVAGAGRGFRGRRGCASSNRCARRGLRFCCWLPPEPLHLRSHRPPHRNLRLPWGAASGCSGRLVPRQAGPAATAPAPACPRPRPLTRASAPLRSPVRLSRPRSWPRSLSRSHRARRPSERPAPSAPSNERAPRSPPAPRGPSRLSFALAEPRPCPAASSAASGRERPHGAPRLSQVKWTRLAESPALNFAGQESEKFQPPRIISVS